LFSSQERKQRRKQKDEENKGGQDGNSLEDKDCVQKEMK